MNAARRLVHPRRAATWLRRLRLAAAGVLLGDMAAVHAAAPVLTMAVAEIPFAAPVLIAQSLGWFAAEGLNLKIEYCTIGRICMERLLKGEVQLATVADTPITLAAFTRKDFSIVATLSASNGGPQLIVRTDRGIATAADLRGKRVGVLEGTRGHYFTETFLRFNGIDPADVHIVALDADDAAGALVRGEVDAAGLYDPSLDDALARLGAKAHALPALSFFSVYFNLISLPASAGVSDEDLVKLLRALKRADELIRTQPERARAMTAKALKLDPKSFAATWKHYDYRLQLAPALVSSLEAQGRWAQRARLVPAAAPLPDYLDFIRSGPLRGVDPRAVRLRE